MDLSVLKLPQNKMEKFWDKGIFTIEDLVYFFPKKYLDFRNAKNIKDIAHGEICAVIGKIEDISEGTNYIRVKVRDNKNWFMYIFWFNMKYIKKMIKKGEEYIFCGRVYIDEKYNVRTMTNPIKFGKDKEKLLTIHTIYPKINGISEEYLKKCIQNGLALIEKKDYLENHLITKFGLISKGEALRIIHNPKNEEEY